MSGADGCYNSGCVSQAERDLETGPRKHLREANALQYRRHVCFHAWPPARQPPVASAAECMAPSSDPYAPQVPSHAWDAPTTDRIAAPQGCWRKIRPIKALKSLQLRVHRSPDPPDCPLGEVEWSLTTGRRVFRMEEQQPEGGTP